MRLRFDEASRCDKPIVIGRAFTAEWPSRGGQRRDDAIWRLSDEVSAPLLIVRPSDPIAADAFDGARLPRAGPHVTWSEDVSEPIGPIAAFMSHRGPPSRTISSLGDGSTCMLSGHTDDGVQGCLDEAAYAFTTAVRTSESIADCLLSTHVTPASPTAERLP